MDESWRLRAYRRFRIEELVLADQIAQYLERADCPSAVLNLEGDWLTPFPFQPVVASPLDLAFLLKKLADFVPADGAYLRTTAHDTCFHAAAIRVADGVIAYVIGPCFRTGSGSSDPQAPLIALPVYEEHEAERVAREIGKVARQLSRRCASERGLRLLNVGVALLTSVRSSIEAHEILADTINAFFDSATTTVYKLHLNGEELVRSICASRPLPSDGPDDSVRMGEGVVGEAASFRETRQVLEASGVKRSTLAVPMIAGHRVVGVVSVSCEHASAFSNTDIQACEILANTAALAWERAESDAPSIRDLVTPRSDAWETTVVELMTGTIRSGEDRTRARYILFQTLADSARQLSGAIRASVRIFNDKSGELAVANTSGDGWTREKRANVHRPGDETAGLYAVKSRRPFLIPDTRQSKYYKSVFEDARSNFGVPIVLGDDVVALLTLQSDQIDFFKPHTCLAVEGMVKQCVEVLDRLADIQDHWIANLERSLVKAPDATAICRASVGHAAKILGAHGCSIFLWNEEKKRLVFESSTHPPPPSVRPWRYKLGEGLTGWVGKNLKTLRLNNIKDPKELAQVSADLQWVRREWGEIDYTNVGSLSFLGAPILTGEKLLGVIRVSHKARPGADEEPFGVFDISDDKLIQGVARLLARRMEEVNTLEASADAIGSLGSLINLDNSLADTLEVKTVCDIILNHLRDVATGAHIRVAEYIHGDLPVLRLQAATKDPAHDIANDVKIGENISGFVALKREPSFATDVLKDTRWASTLATATGTQGPFPWVASGACLPLLVGSELVGTLLLEWAQTRKQEFSLDQQRRLQELANHCARAIKRALTYQERVADLDGIRRAGLRFTEILDLKSLYDTILDEALKLSEIDTGLIRLLDRSRTKWILVATKGKVFHEIDVPEPTRALDVKDDFLRFALESREAQQFQINDPTVQEFVAGLAGTQAEFVRRIKGLVIIPVFAHDRSIGFVSLTLSTDRRVEKWRMRFLEILATFAGIAIENARRVQEERNTLPLAVLGAMFEWFMHEIRTPLQQLKNGAAIIQKPNATPEMVDEHLAIIGTAVSRLTDESSRLHQTFATSAKSARFSVDEALNRVFAAWESRTAKEHITLLQPSPLPLPLILGHEYQFEAVAGLLLMNAVEHAHATQIAITTEQQQGITSICFADNGIGIDADRIRGFQEGRFLGQGHRFDKGGWGLAVVWMLVHHNRGDVRFKSELGKGTTISLLFSTQETGSAQSANC